MAPPKTERQKKRDLVRWDEKKDLQILLSIQTHTNKRGIKLPWDDIAKDIGPTVTGNAVIQHLAKIKKRLHSKGENVPSPSSSNRRKSLKRSLSNDSNEADDDDGAGKSDDSYQGPTPRSVRRRLSKVVKHERSTSAGTASRGKHAKKASGSKPTAVSKMPVVKKEEGAFPDSNDKQSDSDDTEDGEEYVASGQAFLRFDNFQEDSDSDVQPEDEEAHGEEFPDSKEAPETPKPIKVVKLQYSQKKGDAEQSQGEQGSQQYQLPPIRTATEHFESVWNDPWGIPQTGHFNPVHFDPNPMARTYGFGHAPHMLPSVSFPPTYGHHGAFPHMMDQRMGYGQGSQDAPLRPLFTPVNMPPMPSMPFEAAGATDRHQAQSQPLPQLTWDNTESAAPVHDSGNVHQAEDKTRPAPVGLEQGAREEPSERFKRRPSSIASSVPNFDDLDI